MYRATTQIQHGVDDMFHTFAAGDEIPTDLLDSKDIEALLSVGAIMEVVEKPVKTKSNPEPVASEETDK